MANNELFIKLGLAALLGFIIGLEREIKRKPLGLKTSSVIAIISCLLTIVSMESAYLATRSEHGIHIQMDPLRLAAQIVSGIGFLGAGVILRRGNDHISGLTTAAMIWGAAGIGIAVGAGFYIEAITVVVLLIVSVELIPFLLERPMKRLGNEHLILITVDKPSSLEQVIDNLQAERIRISHSRIKDIKKDAVHLLELRTKVSSNQSITKLYRTISQMDGVVSIEISN
ncbi:MgtC/SapB family protein [Paenibacillus ihumii]|uniref:MgtC/SapB family protein n=1 Tax=Paenibacillus ihumii TaxID=687436 RepID=UPI0006D79472|nr:MgtC/SapB family protein [Paenibacillus ihumii]